QTALGTLTWVGAGSLWTRELPDGRAVRIVSGDGLHSPRFSSSGRWLAYRNRHDRLSVARSDGQSGASLEGADAVWFPRDDRLAVTRDGDVSVFAPVDGWKPPAVVVKGAGVTVSGPTANGLCSCERSEGWLIRMMSRPRDNFAWHPFPLRTANRKCSFRTVAVFDPMAGRTMASPFFIGAPTTGPRRSGMMAW